VDHQNFVEPVDVLEIKMLLRPHCDYPWHHKCVDATNYISGFSWAKKSR